MIAVPIEIPLKELQRILTEEGKKQPIVQGATPPFNGSILATVPMNKVRVKNIVNVVESKTEQVLGPASFLIPGVLETKIIQRTVPKEVISVVDEGEAYTGEVVGKFVELVSKTIECSYIVHYKIALKEVESFALHNDELTATLVFDWDLTADVKSPLPAGVTIKGALTSKGTSAVKARISIAVEDNAKLKVSIPPGGIQLEARSLAIEGTGVNLVPLIPLNPTALLTTETLAKLADVLPLHKFAQGALDKQGDKLAFGQRLRDVLTTQSRPIHLKDFGYFDAAPIAIRLGQPKGVERADGKFLILPAEIETPIRVVWGTTRPEPLKAEFGTLPVKVTKEINRIADLQVVGDVELKTLTLRLDTAIQEAWKKLGYFDLGYEPGRTAILGCQDRRFLFAIPIRKRGNGKDLITLYAWGRPRVLQDDSKGPTGGLRELRFDDLGWDSDTTNNALKTVSWLAEAPIRQVLVQYSTISLLELDAKIRKYATIEYETDNFSIALGIKNYEVRDVLFTDEYLRIVLRAVGEPFFTLKTVTTTPKPVVANR